MHPARCGRVTEGRKEVAEDAGLVARDLLVVVGFVFKDRKALRLGRTRNIRGEG